MLARTFERQLGTALYYMPLCPTLTATYDVVGVDALDDAPTVRGCGRSLTSLVAYERVEWGANQRDVRHPGEMLFEVQRVEVLVQIGYVIR